MINSVNSDYISKRNSFSTVTNRNSNADYWLAKNNSQILDWSKSFDSILPETIILNPDEARKTHNSKIIGFSIACVTIMTGAGIFFVLKGGPKGFAKGFQSLRNHIERKIQKSKLSGLSPSMYEYLLSKIDIILEKAQIINNFTTVKDYAFKKLVYGGGANINKFPRRIHQIVTRTFEVLGMKTIKSSYAKTMSDFSAFRHTNEKIISNFEKSADTSEMVAINGITAPKSYWIKMARGFENNIDKLLIDNFGQNARFSRYKAIKKSTIELEETFDKKGILWFLSKDTLKTFVADSTLLPNKLKIQKSVKEVKNKISHSPKDLYSQADDIIMKISSTLNYYDKKALEALNIVREDFKTYAKTGKIDKEKIIIHLNDLKYNIGVPIDSNMNTFDLVKDLTNLFIFKKRGMSEYLLEIYKSILPKEEYEKIVKEYSKFIKSLDKLIKLESEDFINKSRDLALGSAPTDILAVIGSLGTLSYYLEKSDNKQERTTIALKYGIPALVGIGTSVYSNARLFAGSKSLFLAGISAFIANRIGSVANNIYESYLRKNGELVIPEKSFEQFVKS